MKIAIFVETYLPYINGVVTHVSTLKRGLEEMGHEVLVFTAKSKIHRHHLDEEDDVVSCPGLKLSKRLYNFALASPISKKRLKILKEFDPDIIHVHQEFGLGIFASSAAKRLNKPLIYTLHTMYDDYLYYIIPKKLVPYAAKIAHKYFKYFAKRADAITGPSQKVPTFLKNLGVTKEMYVVPNAVETEVFSREKVTDEKAQEIRNKYNIPNDVHVGTFVGRLGKEKNVETMLKFFSENVKVEDKLHLMIIGNGPYKPTLEKIAKELNISDMVTFTGEVDHFDLPPYYKASDLYITTSLSDTNSISMLEAMAMGLPTLHIKDPLNRGQIINGENGFVFENGKQMIDYFKMYLDFDEKTKNDMIQNTINFANKQGSLALATKILDIYKSVLKTTKNKYK